MQLVSNDSHTRDASETEPILPQFNTSSRSTEATSSCEIQPLADDRVVNDNDQQNLDADENCSLVNASQPICRICFDSEGEDLIAPCDCKGTQKYVHRSCLDHWRSTKEGFAFAHCTECRALFELRANVPPDRWLSRLKFQLLVIRDHALIFVCVQLIVAMFGMLVYKFYGTELREMFGYEEHPYGFYTMAVLAIILVGLLYGFFIAIICGQKISERHYHVLAKQELTKVIFLSLLGCSLAGIVLNLMRIHKIGLASFRDYNFPPVAEISTGMRFRIMVAANFWPILDICLNINICVVACLQEFVVVSREENDNVAPRELDPTHVTELRTLGLY